MTRAREATHDDPALHPRLIPVKDIQFLPYNSNRMSEAQSGGLEHSIGDFGFLEAVVLNDRGVGWAKKDRGLFVVGGEHRVRALQKLKRAQIVQLDVWSVKKVPPVKMVHLTEKPVELARKAILLSSRPAENVLDLFGGSGSTLIAAEQAGRTAFLMEMDPRYCDVIRDRWKAFTSGERKEAV